MLSSSVLTAEILLSPQKFCSFIQDEQHVIFLYSG